MDILKDIIVALAKAVINQTVIYYFGKKSAKKSKKKTTRNKTRQSNGWFSKRK